MKKLMMFAAAMTIVGGAYASGCTDPEVDTTCAYVYDLKISLKTTLGKGQAGSEGTCGDVVDASCYRKIGKASLKGYIYTCDCTCEAMKEGTLILWDTKADMYVIEDGALSWEVLSTIGKDRKDAEGYWTLESEEGTFAAAGFGKWDQKADRLSSMSGDIVGKLPAPVCEDTESCDPAIAYPCNVLEDGSSDVLTVGHGTWSIKYNKGKSNDYAESGMSGLDLPEFN